MIERFEKFSFDISQIYHYWHKLTTEEMAKFGLKGSNAVYLTMLYQNKEGLTCAELSSLCNRDKADVSRTMNTMEQKGFVKKISPDNKLYRARMVLTEEGKVAAESVNDRVGVAVELGGKGLTDEQRMTFYYALDLIASNLQKISEEGLLGK